MIDLPTIRPLVSEYQLFDIHCPFCGIYHEAPLPVGVPIGMLGPRLLAETGVLSGRFHLSVRKLHLLGTPVARFPAHRGARGLWRAGGTTLAGLRASAVSLAASPSTRAELDAATYRCRMQWLRRRVRVQLELGAGIGICKGKTARTCKQILRVELARREPTNNAAERALRPLVIWRKLSFQTQSARGEQFVARLLTAVETCRRQQRPASAYLLEAVTAHLTGTTHPALIPQPAST